MKTNGEVISKMKQKDETPNSAKGVILAAMVGILFILIIVSMIFVMANGLNLDR